MTDAAAAGLAATFPHQELFARARKLVADAAEVFLDAHRLGHPLDTDLAELNEQASDPFSIFVCGEFNAGKSSLINSLAGEALSEVGVLPTTREIVRLKTPRLPGLMFVDSPGLNSIMGEHQRATERYLKRSDFVLFMTSVERPLADSELRFLREACERWKRKIVLVLNKADLLDRAELDRVRQFVAEGIKSLLGIEPPLFPVSTRSGAGIPELVAYLQEIFTERERSRLKLLGVCDSLGVFCAQISESVSRECATQESAAAALERTLERISRRVEESRAYFDVYRERVDRTFSELSKQLGNLIDTQFGLLRVLKAKLTGNQEYTKASVRDVIESMNFDTKLQELVEDAAGKLLLYRTMIASEAAEDVSPPGQLAPPALAADGQMVKAAEISGELKAAVERGMRNFFALSSAAAASGISAKVATLASVEITSAVLMLALALVGFRALPAQREKLKAELAANFRGLAASFSDSLSASVREHLEGAANGIRSGIEPKLTETREGVARLREILARLDACKVEISLLKADLG